MLTYRKEIPYAHQCVDPSCFSETWSCEVGSLWQCNQCGREWIKVERTPMINKWRYTVEIVDKRVQKARGRKSVQN